MQRDLEALIQPLLTALGYVLWGIEYHAQGRDSILRIYIDKLGGIELEDCALASRQISALLDVEDPISGHYSLEVSSPGVPRPLFKLDQYAAYVGKEVKLKLGRLVNGSRKMTGEIVGVSEDAVTLKVAADQICIPFSYIVKAQLIGE